MFKHLLVLCLFTFAFQSEASVEDDFKTRIEWVKEVKSFMLDLEQKNPERLSTSAEKNFLIRFYLFQEAIASGNYDCFFAGWPSKLVSSNGRRLCVNPAKGNTEYKKGSCLTGQLQCQPVIFGQGICVGFSSSKDKQLAFSSCDSKFKQKINYDFLKTMSAEDKAALKEVSNLAHKVCVDGTVGVQKSKPMCKSLMSKFKNAQESIDRALASEEDVLDNKEVPVQEVVKKNPSFAAEIPGIDAEEDENVPLPAPLLATVAVRPVVVHKNVVPEGELIPLIFDFSKKTVSPSSIEECKDDVVVDQKVVTNADVVLKAVNHDADTQYEKIKQEFLASALCAPELKFECHFVNKQVFRESFARREMLQKTGSSSTRPDEITIIDYSRPIGERRKYVIDLKMNKVLEYKLSEK